MKKIIEPAVFLILFLIINSVISAAFTNRIMSLTIYNRQDKEFCSSQNDLQYLIMGDSQSGAAINPEIIGSAYNYASPGESYIQTYYKLKHILNSNFRKIDTIVLPLDLHSFSSFRTDRILIMNQRYQDSAYWTKYIDFIELGLYKNKLPQYIQRYLLGRFFNYAGRMNNFFEFYFKEQVVYPTIKGFTKFEGDYREIRKEYPERAKQQAGHHLKNNNYFDKYITDYFKRTLELCYSNKIGVILVKFPVSKDYYTQASNFVSEELLSQRVDAVIKVYSGITVFDYRKVFFDHNEWFADSHHLNNNGGNQLSKIFKADLTELQGDKMESCQLKLDLNLFEEGL